MHSRGGSNYSPLRLRAPSRLPGAFPALWSIRNVYPVVDINVVIAPVGVVYDGIVAAPDELINHDKAE
jgi:hypothetical protein